MSVIRKLLRLPALREKLGGISTATVYRAMERQGFPRPIKMTRRVSLWDESTVDTWIDEKGKANKAIA